MRPVVATIARGSSLDTPDATGSTLRLALRLFALALGVGGLGGAAAAWWWLDGPGSACWPLRDDPSAACRSELWMFTPPLSVVAAGLTGLFLACLLAARVRRSRAGTS